MAVVFHDQLVLDRGQSSEGSLPAAAVLGREYDHLGRPRQAGRRAALRVLLAARAIMDQQRTANRNALNALLRSIDLGIDARKAVSDAQVRTVAAWRITRRDNRPADPQAIARREARRLAAAVLEQTEMLRENHRELRDLAEELAPGQQTRPGIGPVTAAITCATTPTTDASDPRQPTQRSAVSHHCQRPRATPAVTGCRESGERQLNRAFDVIVRTRMSYDPATREYVARRRGEGRSNREIRRCLKAPRLPLCPPRTPSLHGLTTGIEASFSRQVVA